MEKSFLEDFKFEENKRTFNFQLIDKNILELKEEKRRKYKTFKISFRNNKKIKNMGK